MIDPLLAGSWDRLWHGLQATGEAGPVRDELLWRHTEPWRRYHTTQHLAECLAHFEPVRNLAERPAEVEAAIWFHDAVYELGPGDNEARSAALAERLLGRHGVSREVLDRIVALIMATRHDAAPTESDARLLVDVDLAILGAPAPRFAEYERQIREEYAFVPAQLFVSRRREILAGFLARPRLYGTAHFFGLLELAARANLTGAVGIDDPTPGAR